MPKLGIPRATYRLQLHAGFTFRDAAEIVPYLSALGISHCYCSPYLKARPGSTHGYDVVDHAQLNPEIGSQEDFEHFIRILHEHGMGQIVDVVPNHIAVMGRENPWWLDVLENGPASEFADFFDIDWYPLRASLTGKVLLPVLGEHYATVLESGELELAFDAERGSFALEYHEHLFPVDPREYPRILAAGLGRLEALCDSGAATAFESLVTAFANLPERTRLHADRLAERRRDKEVHKQRLAAMVAEQPGVGRYVDECLELYNGAARGEAAERLHALLEAQAYRLAYWRVASHEINYRRFFDINQLASLRMENRAVFDAVHRLILEQFAAGHVQGARIDHPDGLYDPAGYFRRLSEEIARALGVAPGRGELPAYVVAEKILAQNEALRSGWRVHGTTGYDFAALIGRLFVYPNGMPLLDKLYAELIGERTTLRDTAYRAKKLIMQTSLASERNVLSAELDRIAESDPRTRDFGLGDLRSALLEIIACLPVYRTYVTSMKMSKTDAAFVDEAVADAKRRSEAADTSVFDFVGDVLTLRAAEGRGEDDRRRLLGFVMKLQQYTGPVAAKGVEDTAFYRYNRLVSLNEVGADPDSSSLSIEAFHRANRDRLRRWPHAMLASSTHDNKRAEDVRARIAVLSELAGRWAELARGWTERNDRLKQRKDAPQGWPDRNAEYLLYQTLIGAWPAGGPAAEARGEFIERIKAYMNKALKEAKAQTSWINPNEEYEQAVAAFIERLLDEDTSAEFLSELADFQALVSKLGSYNALSQTLLKLTVPGVPDVYQGCELPSFDLVDPDNRRPVDYALRRDRLEQVRRAAAGPAGARELIERMQDGTAKLHVVHAALASRAERPRLFERGDYEALVVRGQLQVYLCAFARRDEEALAVVLAPRWFATLTDGGRLAPLGTEVWKDTTVVLPECAGSLRNVLTGETLDARPGERVEVGRLLCDFPVALLANQP